MKKHQQKEIEEQLEECQEELAAEKGRKSSKKEKPAGQETPEGTENEPLYRVVGLNQTSEILPPENKCNQTFGQIHSSQL